MHPGYNFSGNGKCHPTCFLTAWNSCRSCWWSKNMVIFNASFFQGLWGYAKLFCRSQVFHLSLYFGGTNFKDCQTVIEKLKKWDFERKTGFPSQNITNQVIQSDLFIPLNLWKGHLTFPKKSQRIARKVELEPILGSNFRVMFNPVPPRCPPHEMPTPQKHATFGISRLFQTSKGSKGQMDEILLVVCRKKLDQTRLDRHPKSPAGRLSIEFGMFNWDGLL